MEHFESSLRSRLGALDAPTNLEAVRPTVDAITPPSLDTMIRGPSLGRRASRGLARFLVVFCIGFAAALVWQSYGDVARATIANLSPQFGWLAPQTASVVPTATDVVAPAVAATPDLQQLALGLASIRQSIDQLAAQLAVGQQQMAGDIAKLQADENGLASIRQSVDQLAAQLAAGREQTAGDIAKLRADEQEILRKLSAAPPRPAAAPARKPAPVTPPLPSPSAQAR
jgi:hypothetical protein